MLRIQLENVKTHKNDASCFFLKYNHAANNWNLYSKETNKNNTYDGINLVPIKTFDKEDNVLFGDDGDNDYETEEYDEEDEETLANG